MGHYTTSGTYKYLMSLNSLQTHFYSGEVTLSIQPNASNNDNTLSYTVTASRYLISFTRDLRLYFKKDVYPKKKDTFHSF